MQKLITAVPTSSGRQLSGEAVQSTLQEQVTAGSYYFMFWCSGSYPITESVNQELFLGSGELPIATDYTLAQIIFTLRNN
jgi:hypothetical protein